MTTYTARPIEPEVLKDLRTADDAGRPMVPFTDEEGGAPLRCCLRRGEPGERIALVSYAPLRRWAAAAASIRARTTSRARSSSTRGSAGAAADVRPFEGAHRTVRRYSAGGRILGGRLVEVPEWSAFEAAFEAAFADPAVELVHVRAVEYGCFLYEVRRA
ncbi:DUF1203 domain-containing protein [Streptomyces kaempferi]